jgi:L-ascorbate metabolism protein UlaG (beta-lactamase superfamily)
MEITWYGLGCFRMNERGYPAIVTDPFYKKDVGYELPHLTTEIITLSTPLDNGHDDVRWTGMRGKPHIFASPGEYELGGLFVTGIASYRDNKKGSKRGENIIYTYSVNGLSICHLGDLGHVPNQTQIETIGPVDVLLVPVGVPGGMTPAMASEVISLIEPNIIVPMDYKTPGLKNVQRKTVGRFLKEMGMSKEKPQATLKVSASSMSEETEVILLTPKQD